MFRPGPQGLEADMMVTDEVQSEIKCNVTHERLSLVFWLVSTIILHYTKIEWHGGFKDQIWSLEHRISHLKYNNWIIII